MTTDLSVCQAALDRDPVLYLDLTEAVRRGIGTVLYASPTAALVDIPSPEQPDSFHTYLMSCTGMGDARFLCGLHPLRAGFDGQRPLPGPPAFPGHDALRQAALLPNSPYERN